MSMVRAGWRWIDRGLWAPADPRVYALVRIGFSIAALANWAELFARRHEYFGSTSLIDMGLLLQQTAGVPYWSVFYFASSDIAVTALFAIAGIAIVALGLGYQRRLAAVLVYVWHVSYAHAGFPILHGWDSVLRVYAFLLVVSPLPATWSLDSRLRDARLPSTAPPMYGLRLMQWQLAVIYLGTVWLKVDDVGWRHGDVVALFQMSIYSRTPNAMWLAYSPMLTNLLTWASLAIETSVVFLLASARWRAMGLVLGLALHGSIAVSTTLTSFSLAILAPYASFLTSCDLDQARSVAGRTWARLSR